MKHAIQIAALLVVAGVSHAQAPSAAYDKASLRVAEQSAQAALGTFSQLVTDRNVKALGFDEVGQVRTSRLGAPIAQYMVRLDELKQYAAGADPAGLLHSTGRVTYPLIANGAPRSGITLARKGETWTAESFGGASYVRLLDEVRAQSSRAAGRSLADYFEVRVPALNFTFIGYRDNAGLQLLPILAYPALGMDKGMATPASDVFQKLVPLARAHNDLPGGR